MTKEEEKALAKVVCDRVGHTFLRAVSNSPRAFATIAKSLKAMQDRIDKDPKCVDEILHSDATGHK